MLAPSSNFPSALAQLLVKSELRRQFRSNPQAVAEQLNLDRETRAIFCQLSADQVDRQAHGLISKRCYEVRQILPQTWSNLEPQEARDLFFRFAETYWPEGHNRHRLDALAFCEFLDQTKTPGLVRAEWNWLDFCLSRRRFRLHFVRDLKFGTRPHTGIQLFYRRSGVPRWFVIRFPQFGR